MRALQLDCSLLTLPRQRQSFPQTPLHPLTPTRYLHLSIQAHNPRLLVRQSIPRAPTQDLLTTKMVSHHGIRYQKTCRRLTREN